MHKMSAESQENPPGESDYSLEASENRLGPSNSPHERSVNRPGRRDRSVGRSVLRVGRHDVRVEKRDYPLGSRSAHAASPNPRIIATLPYPRRRTSPPRPSSSVPRP